MKVTTIILLIKALLAAILDADDDAANKRAALSAIESEIMRIQWKVSMRGPSGL